jgi:hypothetical protein
MENTLKNAIPVGDGLLTAPLYPLEDVRLLGTRCKKCNEVMFGRLPSCANCASEEVEEVPLSNHGILWTYTIIYHCPPGDYRGPKDPFVPTPLSNTHSPCWAEYELKVMVPFPSAPGFRSGSGSPIRGI